MNHRNMGFDGDIGDGGSAEGSFPAPRYAPGHDPDTAPDPAAVERTLVYLGALLGLNNASVDPPEDAIIRPAGDHPGTPSGFTYLYQLAAHDLTHTALEAGPADGMRFPDTNLRVRPLELETLFGGGPIGCRHAYDMQVQSGAYPLRLGQFRHEGQRTGPVRDLPRAYFAEDGGPPSEAGFTDVLIADSRNDDNNLLAQMTALWAVVYNALVARAPELRRHGTGDPVPAHRLARIARRATVRIYRRILREDLLPRLMRREIWRRYRDTGSAVMPGSEPVSREFRFAASRAAHFMVRPAYFLNSGTAPRTIGKTALASILAMSSLHRPRNMPVPRDWMIDWSFFFQTGDAEPDGFNWALRLDPRAAHAMTLGTSVSKLKPGYPAGVLMRDLLRDHLGGLNSVAELAARAREAAPGIATPQARRALIDSTLAVLEAAVARSPLRPRITPEDREVLLDHPPLTFFLLAEAMAHGDGGRTYGPLGSVIVGDAFLPVFQPEDTWNIPPEAEALERLTFGPGPEIDRMTALIDSLRVSGALDA